MYREWILNSTASLTLVLKRAERDAVELNLHSLYIYQTVKDNILKDISNENENILVGISL